ATVTEKEMAMASALISGMSTPLDWAKYKDNYRDRLKEVLEAKMEGREVEALPEIVSTVNDLEAMLAASLAAVGAK
ncbi:MAG: Ku protein, partial [Dehalococcoidia bacterium]|nr:Ku protein [Dehalococcoidia bacterium]